MEQTIGVILSTLMNGDNLTDISLQLIIIGLLVLLYKFLLKPIFDKIKIVPNEEKIGLIVEEKVQHVVVNPPEINIEEILEKLDELSKMLNKISEIGKNNSREILELRRDIEVIKSILNQFQGHLLYGSRRSSDFGNQELR